MYLKECTDRDGRLLTSAFCQILCALVQFCNKLPINWAAQAQLVTILPLVLFCLLLSVAVSHCCYLVIAGCYSGPKRLGMCRINVRSCLHSQEYRRQNLFRDESGLWQCHLNLSSAWLLSWSAVVSRREKSHV